MKTILACAATLAVGVAAHAATLTYFPTEQTGGQTVNLQVMFNDSTGNIVGTVEVLPTATDTDVGDIRALYFDLSGTSLTAAQVAAAISGAGITAVSPATSVSPSANVNPLGPFDIGIEFGTPGIGRDDFQSAMFTIDNAMLTPGLTLSNFGAVAVRVNSIGAPGGARGGSGKFLDMAGEAAAGVAGGPVPEPASLLLMGAGMIALALLARRRVS